MRDGRAEGKLPKCKVGSAERTRRETEKVLKSLVSLPKASLERIRRRAEALIQEADCQGAEPKGHYRAEYVKCGRAGCGCKTGAKLHGPYWYHYTREGGKLRRRYLGRSKPPGA